MILTMKHFLQGSNPNLAHMNMEDIEYIHCYHATRLLSNHDILTRGIRLPSVSEMVLLLTSIGIENPETDILEEVIATNGGNIFVNLNKSHLIEFGNFHKKGSEKVRKYIVETCPDRLESVEAQIEDEWVGLVFEMTLPVEYYDHNEIQECFSEPDEILFDNTEEIDITLEVIKDIPPEFLTVCWSENESSKLNKR